MLSYLVKQENFVPSNQDFRTFIEACLNLQWYRGLQTFLQSYNMKFIYASLPTHQEKYIVQLLLKSRDAMKVIPLRPFLRHIFTELLQKNITDDASLYAQECLKHLTSDDFGILLYQDNELVSSALESYNNENESLKENVEKVLNRIRHEVLDQ